jgi:soluble lytic murein transglycosylase-like protein
MNIEARREPLRASQVGLGLLMAALVAGSVLFGLAALQSGHATVQATARLSAHSGLSGAGSQSVWLRKTPGWTAMPSSSLAEVPSVVQLPPARETSRAQRRLTDHIVDGYQLDAGEAARVVALAYEVAGEVRLDPLLLLAVMSVESSFNTFAQSVRGAQGLMQIHTRVHAERFEPFGGSEAVFDPQANIRVGAELLRIHLLREGSTEAALKAYVGAARRPHDSGYGARVLRARDVLRGVAEGHDDLVTRALPAAGAREGASRSGS